MDDAPPRVPLAGYDEQVARLDNIFDAVVALTETVVAALSGKKNFQPTRATRPETAAQRAHRQRTLNRLDDIVQQMTGGR